MRIAGLQPLSLLDYPGKVAALIFTQGCPFRCAYCHNPELIPVREGVDLPENEVLTRLEKRREFLDGVCVTGGEPTVHPDLPEFLSRLKALGLAVKLDTNGVHPRMMQRLLDAGLIDFVAMDLKHVWRRYGDVAGPSAGTAADNCRATQMLIGDSGVAHEFRTTVWSAVHAENDLLEIASGLPQGSHYALQRLRFGNVLDPGMRRGGVLDLDACAERIQAARPDLHIEVRA